ncbi:MAG: hypothetical protein CMO74_01565 [Verrucomicrobiales bacterium]|nr:hypothetical protein [Verrucomicrobiales bacterium]|tara:strand:- start:26545 stop:26748 length:204 start_codon:yes stop_codon:yes gene_type:complete
MLKMTESGGILKKHRRFCKLDFGKSPPGQQPLSLGRGCQHFKQNKNQSVPAHRLCKKRGGILRKWPR